MFFRVESRGTLWCPILSHDVLLFATHFTFCIVKDLGKTIHFFAKFISTILVDNLYIHLYIYKEIKIISFLILLRYINFKSIDEN